MCILHARTYKFISVEGKHIISKKCGVWDGVKISNLGQNDPHHSPGLWHRHNFFMIRNPSFISSYGSRSSCFLNADPDPALNFVENYLKMSWLQFKQNRQDCSKVKTKNCPKNLQLLPGPISMHFFSWYFSIFPSWIRILDAGGKVNADPDLQPWFSPFVPNDVSILLLVPHRWPRRLSPCQTEPDSSQSQSHRSWCRQRGWSSPRPSGAAAQSGPVCACPRQKMFGIYRRGEKR